MELTLSEIARDLTTIVFLATINTKFIDYLKAPVQRKWPTLDMWWVTYVALLTGIVLGWLAQANVFEDLLESETAAILLTGFLIGGGSSLIYDIFGKKQAKVTATAEEGGSVQADVTMKAAPVEK